MATNATSGMPCTVCQRHKHQLRPRKSKLIEGMQMWLCNDCFVSKKEPRFAIIMRGRKDAQKGLGLDSVAEYLRLHRYEGEEILAVDLT